MTAPITPELLKVTLADHLKWWYGEDGGKRADLRSANLSDANLSDADLSGADLSDADLSDADLSDANGIRRYFEEVKADVFAVLASAPLGTMENSAQQAERFDVADQITRDAGRPAEVFFRRIQPGDTPSNSPDAALASIWVREYLASRVTPEVAS